MSNRPVNEEGYQRVLNAVKHDAGVQGGYSTVLRDVLRNDDPSVYSKNMLEALEVSFDRALNKDMSAEAVKVFYKVNDLVHKELDVDYVESYYALLTKMHEKVNSLPGTTQSGEISKKKEVAQALYSSALESYDSVRERVEHENQMRSQTEAKNRIKERVAKVGASTAISRVMQDMNTNVESVRASSTPKVGKGGLGRKR